MSRERKERPRKRGEPARSNFDNCIQLPCCVAPWPPPPLPFLRGVVPLQKEAVPVPRACSATTKRRRSVEQCSRKQVFRASQMLGTLPIEHVVIRLRLMSPLSLIFVSFDSPWGSLYACAPPA